VSQVHTPPTPHIYYGKTNQFSNLKKGCNEMIECQLASS
jgi:hypothetical protein